MGNKVFVGIEKENDIELIVLPDARISSSEKSIGGDVSFVSISAYGKKDLSGKHTIVYHTELMNTQERLRLLGEFFNWGEIEDLVSFVNSETQEEINDLVEHLRNNSDLVVKAAIKKAGY